MKLEAQKITYKTDDGHYTGPAVMYELPNIDIKRVVFWMEGENVMYEISKEDDRAFIQRIGTDDDGCKRCDRDTSEPIDTYILNHITEVTRFLYYTMKLPQVKKRSSTDAFRSKVQGELRRLSKKK